MKYSYTIKILSQNRFSTHSKEKGSHGDGDNFIKQINRGIYTMGGGSSSRDFLKVKNRNFYANLSFIILSQRTVNC